MPMKKHLRNEEEERPSSGQPPAAIGPDKLASRSAAPRDSQAAITTRLGARYWSNNHRFEWARDENKHHYEFTRFYFEQLVIVDIWPALNNGARKQSEKKRACVEAENARRIARGEKPIGLISFVRGTIVPDECFDAALRGQTMALIEPASEGLLV